MFDIENRLEYSKTKDPESTKTNKADCQCPHTAEQYLRSRYVTAIGETNYRQLPFLAPLPTDDPSVALFLSLIAQ